MAWCFEDESGPYADAVLESFSQSMALTPAIWPLEVGNMLVVAERRGRLTKADSVRFLNLLRQLPIVVEPETARRMFGEILALAREQNISTYDASYLDLAMRSGLPLATQDAALGETAGRCSVAVYQPAKG
jgi:predicted nucleic acid-binding protein